MATLEKKKRRRSKEPEPQPSGVQRALIDRDIQLCGILGEHDFLTLKYLLRLHPGSGVDGLRKRMWNHCNDTIDGLPTPLFYQPEFQRAAQFLARPTIYGATKAARQLAFENDLPWKDYAPPGEDELHKYMRMTCGASFKIAIQEDGKQWFSKHAIFNADECPQETQVAKSPLELDLGGGHKVIPDDLLRWHNGEVYRGHMAEYDRGTEDIKDYGKGNTSIEKKIPGYDTVFEHRLYTTKWGIKGRIQCLIVTTTEGRAKSIVRLIGKLSRYPDRYVVTWQPFFAGRFWKIAPVMTALYTEPYLTFGGRKQNGDVIIKQVYINQ